MTKDTVAAAVAELLPCPFCGEKPVTRRCVEEYEAGDDGPAGDFDARFEIDCDTCGISMGEEYRDDAVAAWNRRAASPVQAGIDPLVALVDRLENPFWVCTKGMPSVLDDESVVPDMREAAALIRSQAERIAALEEAATAKDIEHRAQICAMAERFRAVNIQRVIEASGDDILAMRERTEAAESLLAEAREALEKNANDAVAAAHHIDEHSFSFALGILSQIEFTSRSTLSWLKPGEKGGE